MKGSVPGLGIKVAAMECGAAVRKLDLLMGRLETDNIWRRQLLPVKRRLFSYLLKPSCAGLSL